MSIADQLLAALRSSGADKMCITVDGQTGNYQPQPQPLRLTVQFVNEDGSTRSSNGKRALESDEVEVPAGKRRKGAQKTVRKKTKMVDMAATLAAYRERISALPADSFRQFTGAFLADYKLHLCTPEDRIPKTHAYVLADIAREHGFQAAGFVSANKKDKKYIESLPNGLMRPDEGGDAKIVYVGDKNQFTKQEASVWALLKTDKVMVPYDPSVAAAMDVEDASTTVSAVSATSSSSATVKA